MKYRSLSAIAGLVLVAGTASASASTITLSFEDRNDAFGGVSSNVTVRYGRDWYNQISTAAGGFHMQDDAGNSLIAWCLDLFGALTDDHTYETTESPFSGRQIAATTLANIQSLFDTNYKNLDLDDDGQSGGFQLALWEVLYERTDTYNIDGGDYGDRGSFYAKSRGTDEDAVTWANKFLGNIANDTTGKIFDLTFYDADALTEEWKKIWWNIDYQDLVSASEIPPSQTPEVPLPATAWLLGGGLAALFGIGRRRKAVTA